MWSTLMRAPRRDGLTWTWDSSDLPSALADRPFAAQSAPAPTPAATPVSAAACFRNRLRPDPLESMIASRDPEYPIWGLGLTLGFLLEAECRRQSGDECSAESPACQTVKFMK